MTTGVEREIGIVLPEWATGAERKPDLLILDFLKRVWKVREALNEEADGVPELGIRFHWGDAILPEDIYVELEEGIAAFKTMGIVKPGDIVVAASFAHKEEVMIQGGEYKIGDYCFYVRPQYEDPRVPVVSGLCYQGNFSREKAARQVFKLTHLGGLAGIKIPERARVRVFPYQ